MSVLHLTQENFDDTISTGLVLVDFWASWCMPCKMLAPVIEALAEKHNGTVKVCKVDVDEQPGIAVRYSIMSVPTVYLFKDGAPVDKIIGVSPIEEYESIIKNA